MSADTLTATSRHFYERTKSKVAISIIVSAAGLGALGFCAATGGLSASSNDQAKNSSGDSKDALEAQAAGYGEFRSLKLDLFFILIFINRICRICFYLGIHSIDCRCYLCFTFILWK